MSSNSKPDPLLYEPIPTQPNPNPNSNPNPNPPNFVVLPFYPIRRRRHCLRRVRHQLLLSSLLFLLCIVGFLLWPSDPNIQLARIKLNNIRVNSSPFLSLDLSLDLTIRVRNPDFFSLDYDSLGVGIGYRGRELGFVDSNGGKLKARGMSYVNATLVVDGLKVLHDLVYLMEDIASGSVPFDTVSTVKGKLGLSFFKIPIQTKVSCEVYIDPMNQTIKHQSCYPE